MQVIIILASAIFGAYFHTAVINVATIVGSNFYNIACQIFNLCN